MCPLGVTDIAITRLIQLGNTKRKTLPRFYPYFYIPPTPLDLNKGEREAGVSGRGMAGPTRLELATSGMTGQRSYPIFLDLYKPEYRGVDKIV